MKLIVRSSTEHHLTGLLNNEMLVNKLNYSISSLCLSEHFIVSATCLNRFSVLTHLGQLLFPCRGFGRRRANTKAREHKAYGSYSVMQWSPNLSRSLLAQWCQCFHYKCIKNEKRKLPLYQNTNLAVFILFYLT